MHSYSEILNIYQESLSKINSNNSPLELYEPISYTLESGGKRIRPVLLTMAYNLYKNNIDYAINAGLAIEIFHNFTLLHDDIMDKSDFRRNRPTVHRKWDANTAILSGDAMQIQAYSYLSKYPEKHLKKIIEVFNKTALEVCEGQQYDMNFETEQEVTTDKYLEMIRLKTAVLLACSLKIGGILADAPEKDIDNLYMLGINLGMAFQLQDDYLDTFGNEKDFGKPIGNDIASNKKTFLLLKALEKSSNIKKEELLSELENNNKEEKIKNITQLYKSLEVEKESKELMETYYFNASKNLDVINVDSDKKTEIRKVFDKLKNRIS